MTPASASHPAGKPVRGIPGLDAVSDELLELPELDVLAEVGEAALGPADGVVGFAGVVGLPANGSVYCVPPASWARAAAGTTASTAATRSEARKERVIRRYG
jgi:hypothetical protein